MSAKTHDVQHSLQPLTVSGWEGLPWLVHGFSTRPGGESVVYRAEGERGELNLGFTPADSRDFVAHNRELLVAHLLGPDAPDRRGLVTVRQTHSSTIHRVDQSHTLPPSSPAVLEGDGLTTDVPGVLLGILTADCVPVLVVDPVHRAVGAFHAGWRGTIQQIVGKGIARMQQEYGSAADDLLAAVGPSIGACCYAVGEEVREQFAARFAYADELFSGDTVGLGSDMRPKLRLDLAEANRRQLLAAGVSPASISVTGACTSCETAHFFSHRAEHGVTGRMMAVVGVRALAS